jgi:hypothetical protein
MNPGRGVRKTGVPAMPAPIGACAPPSVIDDADAAGRAGRRRPVRPSGMGNAADLCASSRTAAAATCDFRIAGGDAPRRDLAIFNEDR